LEELSMDSNDTEIFLLLAQLYYSIGNYIKSKELTEKILSIVPDEKNALHLNILSLLNIYKRKEDIADEEYLIKNLEYLYNNNPSDPVISTELFKLYVDKRDFLKAKEVLEKSKISIKDEETAKKIAFIYLEQENYEKFISTVKYYKLFSFDFIMEIISFLREKGSSFLPIFINDIMQIGKDYLKTDEEIRILLLYLEYIYFSNTLQAWEFYKQRFSEDVKKRYNLYLFELLIYFSLYSEYKDKKYFDSFIELANGLNIEYENMANIEHLSVFSLKVNVTINFVLMFYFIVIKSQYNLIYKLYEFLLSNPDIESNVLNTALSDLLPIFMDNSYYSEVIQIIDNFKLSQISLLKKIRIEALLLLGKNSDVLREVEEYYEKFSYDSYVEIIKIIANFDIYGDIPEHLVNNLEILVQESNPLAFALYAHFLLKTDNNEAKRYATRSLEFLYTEKHNLKHYYQMKIVINILAKFFESTYQLSVFLKGMKQLVARYPDNYTFNYLLAKYLYITEDYIDAELVAKKSLKLTKNSSQLLEAQNLLGKIREEKERYQSFINELEKIDSGISEKIAYVNTLYKKERIEEIFKMLNDISNSNSLSDIIIKFYIFDKLEIKEQLIYYLYLLRAFAFENSYENMLEFIENKLMFYSNVEELEEIKQKAEIDYVKILKNYKQSQLEDFETKKEQEIYLEQYTREEDLERTSQGEMNAEELLQIDVGPTIEIFDNQIDITHDQKEELSEVYIEQKKVSLSNVENYDDLQNVIISNSFDLILAGLLKLFYIIFENNQEKIKEIGVMIDNSQIQLGEDDEKIVVLLQNIEEKILLNDVKSLMIDIKNFVQKYSKNRYFSFYISMILAAFNYKIGKTGDFKRHLKYCKENIENYQFLGKLLNMIDKYPGVEEIKEVPISEIKEFANPPYKDEKIVIISPQELILAYFVRILLIVFGHSNYLQDFIDEQLKNLNFVLDDKEHILIEFLQKVIAGLIQNDMKSVLVDVKNFINNNSKDPYFSFYYSLIMVFISYKLKRIDDFKKYLNIVLKAFNKYQNFQNLLSWLERVGDSIENIDH
ncbi:MAG: hypothetical protein N2169_02625, partial [bacterium]|nr:hypothetical protein [bacterium]